jgi:hypothetical protein
MGSLGPDPPSPCGSGQPPPSDALYRDPTCRRHVATPCARTCCPPWSALVVTLLWCFFFFFLCVCRALGARDLAAGMLAVGLRDGGVPVPDPASSCSDLVEPLLFSGHRWCSGSSSFYTCGRGARSLTAGEPTARLCVRGCPPPVPLVGEGRRHLGSTTVSAMLVPAIAVEEWWRRQGVNSAVQMRQTVPFVALFVRAPVRVLGESSAQP